MPVCEIMLELSEELVDPAEAVLDDQMEETLEDEQDIMLGIGDDDDSVIDFINSGNRLVNTDPVDFTDDDVELSVEDDEEGTSPDEEEFNLDDIEESTTFIY